MKFSIIGVTLMMLSGCVSGFSGTRFADTAETKTGDVMPIFIATSRKMNGDGSVTAELSSTTNYLMNLINIPKNHKTGQIERPTFGSESRNSHFTFLSQRVLDHDRFRAEISAQLSGRVGTARDILVYVHGFNTGYDEARFRLAQIATDSGFTGVPVLFTWPSQNRTFAYGADKDNATASRDDLTTVLSELGTMPGVGRIHILAHSMGTWLTMEALRESAIGEVMLAAPDIDLAVFKQQYARVGAFARVSIFAAADDKALNISSVLAGDRQRVGALDLNDKAQRDEIAKLGVRVYDLSNTDTGDFFRHGTFAAAPAAIRAIGAQLAMPPDDARQAQAFEAQ
jgi:esterase/lipase superfamily enzyme